MINKLNWILLFLLFPIMGHANIQCNPSSWNDNLTQFNRLESNYNKHVDVVGDLNTPFYADAGYAYSLMDINWRQNQYTFYHFTSEHRISGWKETNAMYVALNSQFSA